MNRNVFFVLSLIVTLSLGMPHPMPAGEEGPEVQPSGREGKNYFYPGGGYGGIGGGISASNAAASAGSTSFGVGGFPGGGSSFSNANAASNSFGFGG